ncbi:MAG: hypothetical protein KAR17_21395 [Cyclobacteriaceae bacterium]|nr:hypothetical protein [Cyclobacteriaceae bacterium]
MKKVNLMNALTKKAFLGLGMAALVFSVGCNDDVDPPASGIDDATIEAESIAQSDFEEVDDITTSIMGIAESSSGGRIANVEDDRCHCAEVTHDKENHTITIDFGDGCEGPNGIVRSGIIFITYHGHRFVPGSYWTVTFRNYFVNRRHIEGLRTVTNVSESLEVNPTFHITLEKGKVTWPDETFTTREVDRIRVWVRAANPLMDETHILAGSVTSGMNRRGVSYKTEVLTDLVYKRNCRNDRRIRIPVQGTKRVVIGDRSCVIDFGDGECDAIIEITCGDQTRIIDRANSDILQTTD